jgi:DNA polymerase-3 subunit alpha
MSKKKVSVMEAERASFVSGAAERGVEADVANELFDEMASFANYAFNKSHAAAYGLISFRTAYLKAHYPQEYLASLLTSVLGNAGKIAEYIAEAQKMGIAVLPPDINESRMAFTVSGRNIRFGLLALRNVGQQFVRAMLEERRHGAFRSFEDFVERMGSGDLNKRMVESLIKAGAFDRLGVYRSRLLAVYEDLIDRVQDKNRGGVAGQLDMFSMLSGMNEAQSDMSAPRISYPELPDFTLKEKLMQEKESSGMYFSGHLLDGYGRHIAASQALPLAEIVGADAAVEERQTVRIAGIVTSVTKKVTKKDEQMAFFTVEDRYHEIECLAFPRQYALLAPFITPDSALLIEGNLSFKDEEAPKILVSALKPLTEDGRFTESDAEVRSESPGQAVSRPQAEKPKENGERQKPKAFSKVYLRCPDFTGEVYRKVQNLLDIFDDGSFPAVLYSMQENRYVPCSHGVAMSGYVRKELEALLGEENVVFR